MRGRPSSEKPREAETTRLHDQRHRAPLPERRRPEPAQVLAPVGEVDMAVELEFFSRPRREDGFGGVLGVLRREALVAVETADLPVHPRHRRRSDLEVHVGGVESDGLTQQLIDVDFHYSFPVLTQGELSDGNRPELKGHSSDRPVTGHGLSAASRATDDCSGEAQAGLEHGLPGRFRAMSPTSIANRIQVVTPLENEQGATRRMGESRASTPSTRSRMTPASSRPTRPRRAHRTRRSPATQSGPNPRESGDHHLLPSPPYTSPAVPAGNGTLTVVPLASSSMSSRSPSNG